MLFRSSDDVNRSAADVATSLGLHFIAVPAESFDESTRPHCSFLLVRPDEHIAARLASLEALGLKSAIERALGRKPKTTAPFVTNQGVARLVPYSPAEALFSRLAAEEQLAGCDVTKAMEMLMHGMRTVDAASTRLSEAGDVATHDTHINKKEV